MKLILSFSLFFAGPLRAADDQVLYSIHLTKLSEAIHTLSLSLKIAQYRFAALDYAGARTICRDTTEFDYLIDRLIEKWERLPAQFNGSVKENHLKSFTNLLNDLGVVRRNLKACVDRATRGLREKFRLVPTTGSNWTCGPFLEK